MGLEEDEERYIRVHGLPEKPRAEDWLFEWEVIEKSPLGLPANRGVHKAAQVFLLDVGHQLKLGSLVRGTALILYQRYYLYAEHTVPATADGAQSSSSARLPKALFSGQSFDPYQIASAAVFLAAKVEETPRSLRDVIYISVKTRTRESKTHPGGLEVFEGTERYVEEKQQLLFAERALLRATHFEVSMDHAYRYLGAVRDLLRYTGCVGERSASWWETAYARSWKVLSESFLSLGYLYFRGRDLAAAAMALEFVDTASTEDGDTPGTGALEHWSGWDVLERPEHPEIRRRPHQLLTLEGLPLEGYGVGACRAEAIQAIQRRCIQRLKEH
jgi:hypothetical protein